MEKIKAINYYLPSRPCDEDAVRYASKDTQRLTTSPWIPTMYEDLKKTDFKIYNQKDDKLHGFTESVLASQILAMSAFNGKFGKSGVWEVFGTRPYAEKDYKLTQGQFYSSFNIVPQNVSENDSLQTLMKKIRENMNSQIEKGAPWTSLRGYMNNHFAGTVQKGQFTILSSLGEFKMGGPIKDFRFKTTGNADFGPSLNLFTFNVKSSNDNKYYLVHSHSPQYYSHRESKAWIKSIKHCLSKINLNTKIADAVSELIDVQKDVFKEHDQLLKVVRF
ncbi:hypothetical protein TVAG_036990 [Trichomonas vaginalis G3]|uniref:Uncharacterized protein n=2 Tax=Trichomonas vaginalis (strain ATCC PRA-98 / G3) TaxID=412133 RepID=A2FH41_TRIV3|nr:hypothetical protein TVAG_036990 [Trichomonas vaginalis G3]|eukprot:XP_001308696.1 hypothetical protein [Trichomonas vaginalis G3]